MRYKVLLLCCIAVVTISCYTMHTHYNTIQKEEAYRVHFKNFTISGSLLTDEDRDVITRSVRTIFENQKLLISESAGDADMILDFSFDVRTVGYSIFLMSNVYSIYMDISFYSPDETLFYKNVISRKIFFSPQDYTRLNQILLKSIKKTRSTLSKSYEK